jgi:hypothetical protein
VWLLGGVIFCAYTAYYGTFYLAGFASAAHVCVLKKHPT